MHPLFSQFLQRHSQSSTTTLVESTSSLLKLVLHSLQITSRDIIHLRQ